MKKIRIGILTSSRADYGIYYPLLKYFSESDEVDLTLFVFGMHLLEAHGNTSQIIHRDHLGEVVVVPGMLDDDRVTGVVQSYGNLVKAFSEVIPEHTPDLMIALGDRFEMSAAVQAIIPFEIPLAHFHGGEITLGALDNIYRHQITLASTLHFVAAQPFAGKVQELIGTDFGIHVVGSLSLADLKCQALPTWSEVSANFGIPEGPFILTTYHPETVGAEHNKEYAHHMYKSLAEIAKHTMVVLTGTNADTAGSEYRRMALKLNEEMPDRVVLVENFGKLNYFAAFTNCEFVLGNSSSGILEAGAFNKYVINVGDRQKGRLSGDNVIDVPFEAEAIIGVVARVSKLGRFQGKDLFYREDTVIKVKDAIMAYLQA